MSNLALRQAVETWRRIESTGPAHVGKALRAARVDFKGADGSYQRLLARGGPTYLVEALEANCSRIAGQVKDLEAAQRVRDDWWANHEKPRSLARAAAEELRYRNGDQYVGPDPVRHIEEMTRAEMQPSISGPSMAFKMTF